eukprot:3765804-Pleurochrysis_carterae.AAC.4
MELKARTLHIILKTNTLLRLSPFVCLHMHIKPYACARAVIAGGAEGERGVPRLYALAPYLQTHATTEDA